MYSRLRLSTSCVDPAVRTLCVEFEWHKPADPRIRTTYKSRVSPKSGTEPNVQFQALGLTVKLRKHSQKLDILLKSGSAIFSTSFAHSKKCKGLK